jgi:hypothetical protein
LTPRKERSATLEMRADVDPRRVVPIPKLPTAKANRSIETNRFSKHIFNYGFCPVVRPAKRVIVAAMKVPTASSVE